LAIYQGQSIERPEKQALIDLEVLIKEPIPVVSLIDTFKFGFIPIGNHVARLGVPQKGLVKLPDSFCNLTALQELALFGNRLESLPGAFGNLTALRFLNLVRNDLSALPNSFSKLISIQILYLNDNRLKTLPATFGDLSALQRLNLRNNRLETLPSSLLQLTQLEILWIEKNPLNEGAKEILRTLKQRGVVIDVAETLNYI
jgi:Leucine-rich repeat (LRR) protein